MYSIYREDNHMVNMEIRKLISKANKEGISVATMEKTYKVPQRTIYALLRHEETTGSMEPLTGNCGRPPSLSAQDLEKMRKLIEAQPDITLNEIKEKMQLSIDISAICRYVKHKLGFSYKKSASSLPPVRGKER
jgi:transposase